MGNSTKQTVSYTLVTIGILRNKLKKSYLLISVYIMVCLLIAGCLDTVSQESDVRDSVSQESDVSDIVSQESDSPEASPSAAYLPNETFLSEDPENTNLAGMLQDKACAVVVRIETNCLIGSGIIWKMEENTMTIITAAHVLSGAGQMQIKFADGISIDSDAEGWEWVCSDTVDVAFIKVSMSEIPKETLASCRYACVDKEVYGSMSSDDRILVMGSSDDVAANAYEGSLKEAWIYLEDYGQHMMLGRTYAEPGMSGGGVFDSRGYFLGILSGADENGNLAIVPLNLIWAQEVLLTP